MSGPRIETRNAWVEFPIFDAKSRSLKKTFLGKAAGGTIGRNTSNVVIIEALRDITMSLSLGDRVGLVGHNGRANPRCCACFRVSTSRRGVRRRWSGAWRRCSTWASEWTRRSPATRTSSSAGCSWGRPAGR
ncbi:lipopolysaccharide ABC superfamily ATP binding cassette transporter, ABC protein [Mycobacterium xenopi 4042]|uniref:Lipopolysaccharide ABC superfamily ATP binding cassette transporter, ABC protein n=1 Tax=Mycobacterium xenopi 4042 TaxID=1299334 RepID=X7ZKD3_MYCXE|nr:lipopolysaccharide ABC superfamily ATP binding cassette transporter, ABC protein [Mycobacterium xenopi 4042]